MKDERRETPLAAGPSPADNPFSTDSGQVVKPASAHRGRPSETERDEQIKRDFAALREQMVRPDRAIRMLAKQYCRHPNVIRRALKRSVLVPE